MHLTKGEIADFDRDGYVLIPHLLNAEETKLLRQAARGDDTMLDHAFALADNQGSKIRLAGWNVAGDDTFGLIARSHRVVTRMEAFFRDEVYHYHSKVILKEPLTGGAWEWHQDYGYWYQNGCLYPDMGSCMIAIDRATRENGCLQVLKGSHLMGRIEHGRTAGQTGADMERVTAALDRLEVIYCEMEPGSALFFHGNLLHQSAQNTSADPRWALISCYNTKHNSPYKDSHHPRYTPLKQVSDDALIKAGVRLSTAEQDYIDPAHDKTTEGVKVGS